MKNRQVFRYESIDHLAIEGEGTVGSSKRGGNRDDSWAMTRTYEDAIRVYRDGWSQGATQMSDALAAITPAVRDAIKVANRLAWQHTMIGAGMLDIGRYTVGHPLVIVGPQLAADNPIVKVSVPALWSASVSADRILEAGAVVAAVCDVLSSAGYAVEVNANAGWMNKKDVAWIAQVVLKPASRPLDLDDLAFGIAHPAMSRRFIFAAGELMPDPRSINCVLGGGYGGHASQWSGTTPSLVKGLGDIDLTPMASINGSDLIRVALDAIHAWQDANV